MRYQQIAETLEKYFLVINNKPVSVYSDQAEAARDMEQMKAKFPNDQFEIRREVCDIQKVREIKTNEAWSAKYKRSINCANPQGFSQRAHCAGKKKNENVAAESTDDEQLGEAKNIYTVVFVDPSVGPKVVGKFGNLVKAKKLIRDSFYDIYDSGDRLRRVAPNIFVLEPDYQNTGEVATADEYEHFYHWIIQTSQDIAEESQEDRNARIIAGEIEDAMSQGNQSLAQQKIKELTKLGYYFDKQGRLQRMGMYETAELQEKQDACYRKVKSRYKVWPSAYASGALVQCRKKGAANWGNKSKK